MVTQEAIRELRQFQRHSLLRQFGEDGHVLAENLKISEAIDAVCERAQIANIAAAMWEDAEREIERQNQTMPPVVTTHIHPPIPDRRFDWVAYRKGCEEGKRGYGAAEAEAIADLATEETQAMHPRDFSIRHQRLEGRWIIVDDTGDPIFPVVGYESYKAAESALQTMIKEESE